MFRFSHDRGFVLRALAGMFVMNLLASSVTAQIFVPSSEAPNVETAYDLASEGATITLSGKTHTIDETLDAAGMNLRVVGQVDSTGTPITTIDGQGLRRILIVQSGEDSTTVYENIRFANGFAFGESGGAVQVSNADPRFVNCVFEGNDAAFKGGALHIFGSNAEVAILGCRFVSNAVANGIAGSGGALAIEQQCEVEISDSTFLQNRAGTGGAMWSGDSVFRVERSAFEGNIADSTAGAVHMSGGVLSVLESRFDDNHAVGLAGGAMLLASAQTQIQQCWFDGNSSAQSGGAVQTLGSGSWCGIDQSEFTGNVSGDDGGALSLNYASTVVVESLFIGNSAANDGGAIEIINAAVRLEDVEGIGNSAAVGGFLRQNGGSLELIGSEVTGNLATGTGGLHLMAGSTTDLRQTSVCDNDNEEILGSWNDLGDNCVADDCGCACPADFDGDGVVNGSDFGLLISAWGSGSGPEDLNGDGQVDAIDLGLLLALWGPCS